MCQDLKTFQHLLALFAGCDEDFTGFGVKKQGKLAYLCFRREENWKLWPKYLPMS